MSRLKSIGILYICTGPYSLFWEDFYNTFENKFLPDFEKKYFVFTDNNELYAMENSNVSLIKIDAQPWPLITLCRFRSFLSVEDELKKLDYLMFSNANMVCDEIITPEEFLPRPSEGEKISVTIHPGYEGKEKLYWPYERNKKSKAYVPWNCGQNYVIGAMFSGTSEAFLNMSRTLNNNIEADLKKNIIAKWHDESHLNRYIINKEGIRYLSPAYCYPFGMDVEYKPKMSAVDKQAKFDIKTFKGQENNTKINAFKKIKRVLMPKERFLYLIDVVKRCNVEEQLDE